MIESELKAGARRPRRRPERSISEGIRTATTEAVTGRSPAATTWSHFYNSLGGARNPGTWPSPLRQSWEGRFGQTQPYPFGPDNMQNRGSRASQYSS